MRGKSAQVGMEYLAIVGFVTFVAILILSISNYYTRQTEDRVITSQVYNIEGNLIDASEKVYYYGSPTKTMIEAQMPEKIEAIIINQSEITFKVRIEGGVTDISRQSDVNITGNISNSPGLKKIVIESKGSYVNISTI